MAAGLVHETADVDATSAIGSGTKVWHLAQIRERAAIGDDCVIGRGAYVGPGVRIGDRVKIQNNALVYDPAVVGDGAFIGPGAILTNDRHPRSVAPDLQAKTADDWVEVAVTVGTGAAVGAGAVVVAGVTVGDWALVGAGAVVVRDVAPHALVVGNPARRVGWVGQHGVRLVEAHDGLCCPICGAAFDASGEDLGGGPCTIR
jgi:acetyltransferase-like isoleucine patch superfamily enzyme